MLLPYIRGINECNKDFIQTRFIYTTFIATPNDKANSVWVACIFTCFMIFTMYMYTS